MNHPVLPVPILEGVQRSYSISALWEGTPARATVEKERELLNLVLPPWQRDLCWTLEQQIKYIEASFLALERATTSSMDGILTMMATTPVCPDG